MKPTMLIFRSDVERRKNEEANEKAEVKREKLLTDEKKRLSDIIATEKRKAEEAEKASESAADEVKRLEMVRTSLSHTRAALATMRQRSKLTRNMITKQYGPACQHGMPGCTLTKSDHTEHVFAGDTDDE